MTEFRFQELKSFIYITQRGCEEVARREKGILEETISAIPQRAASIRFSSALSLSNEFEELISVMNNARYY
jgi:hypothetical protein